MKVLLGHNYYRTSAPSGEDTVFRTEQALLAKACDVALLERYNDDIDDTSWTKKLGLALGTTWSRAAYADVIRAIRATKPDIAHFHNTFPQLSPSVYAACRHEGVPVIQTLHNYRLICANGMLIRDQRPCEACVGASLLPALRHRCYRSSLAATAAVVTMLAANRCVKSYARGVSRYICLTEFAAGRLAAGGLPREKLRVKPNFLPDPPAPGSYPREPYAVFVGRLTEEKGVQTLLKAWERLAPLSLKVIGDGTLRADLQRFAAERRLAVEFLGQRPRAAVFELVRRAQLQVVPSECYEGFPMVILEAYASGTPVVASNLGSLSEIIDDGVTGLRFVPGDPADLAAKVGQIASSPELCRALGMAGRQRFEERYTEPTNLQLLLAIYDEALGRSLKEERLS